MGFRDLFSCWIEDVKNLIEKEKVHAPSPVEQRWSACSTSAMSPASSTSGDEIFSWVFIFI